MVPRVMVSIAVAALTTAAGVLPLSAGGHASLLAMLEGLEAGVGATFAATLGAWLGVAWLVRGDRPDIDPTRAILAAVAALAVRMPLDAPAAAWGHDPAVIGAGMVVTGLALASTFWAHEGDRTQPTRRSALLVGAVLGAGTLPGVSGHGLALVTLLWLGLRRDGAFAFVCIAALAAGLPLMVLPASLRDLAHGPGALALAPALALLAYGSARLLQAATRRGGLVVFSVYLVPLGVATLAWSYARP